MTINVQTGPGDTGFSQFTAALISQTMDAVIDAQLQQEEKIRRLNEAAGLTIEQFAENVTADEITGEIATLFPPALYPQGISPGIPYSPVTTTRPEEPPVFSRTGYVMKEGDWQKQENSVVISETGYNNISDHLRMVLAAEHRNNMLQMMRRGIPRVIVDHGHINAKLFFQLASGGTGTMTSALRTATLPRLVVKPVEVQRPEVARLTVNIVGEVEITFKTVSE